MASFGSPEIPVVDTQPSPAPPDFSTVDWRLFVALISSIVCVVVLVAAVACALCGKTQKPKPRLVKKDS